MALGCWVWGEVLFLLGVCVGFVFSDGRWIGVTKGNIVCCYVMGGIIENTRVLDIFGEEGVISIMPF